MKVNLDLTDTHADFPSLVGWYFKTVAGKWDGPHRTIELARFRNRENPSLDNTAFVLLDVIVGFWEMS